MKKDRLIIPCPKPDCKGELTFVRTTCGIDVYVCDTCHQNETSEHDPDAGATQMTFLQ